MFNSNSLTTSDYNYNNNSYDDTDYDIKPIRKHSAGSVETADYRKQADVSDYRFYVTIGKIIAILIVN